MLGDTEAWGVGVSPGIWSLSLLGWYRFGSTCLTGCVLRNRAPFLFVPFVKSPDLSSGSPGYCNQDRLYRGAFSPL